jgi:hypothetical protein
MPPGYALDACERVLRRCGRRKDARVDVFFPLIRQLVLCALGALAVVVVYHLLDPKDPPYGH